MKAKFILISILFSNFLLGAETEYGLCQNYMIRFDNILREGDPNNSEHIIRIKKELEILSLNFHDSLPYPQHPACKLIWNITQEIIKKDFPSVSCTFKGLRWFNLSKHIPVGSKCPY